MLSKLYGYAIAALAAVAAVVGIFMSGRSAGKGEAELDAIEALRNVEAETSDQAQTEQEKINAIHKADHSSLDADKFN